MLFSLLLTGLKPTVECSFITEFEDHIFVTVDAEAFFFLHDLITSYVKEKERVVCIIVRVCLLSSSFGGLEVACWPLVPKFAGSNLAEAVGFFRAKKSSARLPSERK